MTRRPATILQADIARTIRAVQKTGLPVRRVEIDGQKMSVIIGQPDSVETNIAESAFDEWEKAQDNGKGRAA